MDQFPQLLFRQPGNEPMHGGYFSTKTVENESELEAALDDGWHETTPAAQEAYEASKKAKAAEAIAASQAASDSTKAATREELEQKATELEIPFNARVSDKKLAEAIAAKLAGQ